MSSRVMKNGKESKNRADSEARSPTILTANGGFQHPARAWSSADRDRVSTASVNRVLLSSGNVVPLSMRISMRFPP